MLRFDLTAFRTTVSSHNHYTRAFKFCPQVNCFNSCYGKSLTLLTITFPSNFLQRKRFPSFFHLLCIRSFHLGTFVAVAAVTASDVQKAFSGAVVVVGLLLPGRVQRLLTKRENWKKSFSLNQRLVVGPSVAICWSKK